VVLDADRGKLRLGIKAPGGYTIIREELVSETKDANRRSAVEGVDGIQAFGGDYGE
jgi:sRNA-binding carbon storage regulator CsrA